MSQTHIITAAALLGISLALRVPLESDPVTHVLVQFPMLAAAGWLSVQATTLGAGDWNRGGISTIFVALFTLAFWMLPRSIDAALQSPAVETAKFLTIPFLIGAPLAMGWHRAHPLFKNFLKAEAVSMLGVLAFLYTHAPVRICNAYLVNDQERLGYGFLIAAAGATLVWIIPLFSMKPQSRPENPDYALSR